MGRILSFIVSAALVVALCSITSVARSESFGKDATPPSFANPTTPQASDHTEPEVIKVESTYYLYYRSNVDSIIVASSTDGASWIDRATVIVRSGNRLYNASAEGGAGSPDNWFRSATGSSRSDTNARTGTYSLNLNTSGTDADWRSAAVGVSGSKSYKISCYVKGLVTTGSYFLRLRWFSDVGATNFISQDDVPISTGTYGTWTQISGTYAAPSNAVSADLELVSANGSGDLYGDDFSLQEVGDTAGWDSSYTISPSIALYNGTYYLFYEGNDGTRSRIGYATSTSPTGPFTKSASNPVLSPAGSKFEKISVGTPAIVRANNKWYLFYHGYDGTHDRGALAWSTSLSSWTRSPNNPVLPLGANGAWDDYKTAPSSVLIAGSMLYVFYEGSSGGDSWRIGDSSVPLGSVETQGLKKDAANPILSPISGRWDDDWVQLPGVVNPQINGELWMYYSGHNASSNSFSLGKAVDTSGSW